MKYKGYDIVPSSGGGKAGNGCNKTGTIQVRERFNAESYLLKKQIRYKIGDPTSKFQALQKARTFIDELVVKENAQAAAKTDAGAQDALA